ncbi:cytochrome c3 family protein [Deferribacterales bacterium Es71-Z0220]|uniref:cytochrome c3 family protein n=1 Tax=Deferrivibrio essentukiensis TaxID=2880922 RepID=UPI001F61DEC4|nr:cytochrome c3 family protein [Deferrivibrio essentukiensis]MCB4204410.1 cytochrome c3 family protein [Deferrivibrio essentukiensis]
MKKICLFFIIMLFTIVVYAGVQNTKHNLSKSGPGTIKSSTEDRVCVFCHTPHNALTYAPLWNRELSNTVYTTYTSNTLNANPGQPTGNSRLCLSCHDGTIALNAIYNGSVSDLNATISGGANLGTNLMDDHPISFVYDSSLASSDTQLKSPLSLPSFIKLQNNRIECTTCHDPHTEAEYFLRNADKLTLCTACHDKKTGTLTFTNSVHNQVVTNSPISSDYSCGNCHKAHNAKDLITNSQTSQLLRGNEENLCFVCHGSSGNLAVAPVPNGTGKNIESVTDTSVGTYASPGYNNVTCGKSSTNYACHKGKFKDTNPNNFRYYNKSHDVISTAQSGNSTHMECINCHGPHGVQKDNLATTVIESLVDPDTLQPFTPTQSTSYTGTSSYWKKFYRINEFCLKCHDGSYSQNPANRSDLTVSTATNRAPIVLTRFSNETHGSKSIPCLACHDIHSGNYMAMVKDVNWNIDGGAPFSTKDASRTLQTTIYVSNVNFTNFCYGTCHNGRSFTSHSNPHVQYINNGGYCIRCHFHDGGLL